VQNCCKLENNVCFMAHMQFCHSLLVFGFKVCSGLNNISHRHISCMFSVAETGQCDLSILNVFWEYSFIEIRLVRNDVLLIHRPMGYRVSWMLL